MGPRDQRNPPKGAHPSLDRFSPLRISPVLSWLARATTLVRLPRGVRKWARQLLRRRNINRLPLRPRRVTSGLRTGLPSADERCRGTLALSVVGILTRLSLLLPPGSSFQRGSLDVTAQLYPSPDAPLPDVSCFQETPRVSVAGLSPVHLRGPLSRRVSCYALFKGWLLLSLPPRCLRQKTPFAL